jgi:hypothetical protein
MFIPNSSQGARPQYILLGSCLALHARDFGQDLGSRSQNGKIADRWQNTDTICPDDSFYVSFFPRSLVTIFLRSYCQIKLEQVDDIAKDHLSLCLLKSRVRLERHVLNRATKLILC